MYGTIIMK